MYVRIPEKSLQSHQTNIQCFGHHRPTSERPLQWRFAGGSMMARLKLYLDQNQNV